eukprot:scaffold818_cov388-Pavlova_lutheri.AAC.14
MKTSYIYCATKLKFIPSTKEHGHQDGTFLLPMLALQRKCHVAFWALVLKFIVMCNMRVAKSMARRPTRENTTLSLLETRLSLCHLGGPRVG